MLPFCLCTHCCRSERSVPLLRLYTLWQSFVARSALVPLRSVAIPETALSVDSLWLRHYKQIVIQPVHASFPVLLFLARVQVVHHQLVGHSRSQVVLQYNLWDLHVSPSVQNLSVHLPNALDSTHCQHQLRICTWRRSSFSSLSAMVGPSSASTTHGRWNSSVSCPLPVLFLRALVAASWPACQGKTVCMFV